MESLTYFKNLKITPRKFRDTARDVRKLTPIEAVAALEKKNKKAARSLVKVINSAITNAKHTLKVNDDMLEFKLFTIEEGHRLKRYQSGSRGMAKAFYRRFAHVKIILTAKLPEKTESKEEKKKTVKKVTASETKTAEKTQVTNEK